MPLPGTEQWDRGEIARMIAFERETPAAIDGLMPLIASANGEGPQGFAARRIPTDAPFALQWAAELAFASDQVELGLDICSQIVALLRPRPPTPMQWALWAAAGALSWQVATALFPRGVSSLLREEGFDGRARVGPLRLGDGRSSRRGPVEVPWPEASADAVALGRKVLPAVMATTRDRGLVSLDASEDRRGLRPAAETALRLTDEFKIAMFLTGAEAAYVEGAEANLRALEHRYEQRLAFLRESPRWKRLRHPMPLIDWALLCFYVGAIRLGRQEIGARREGRSAATFLWRLALSIDGREKLPLR